MERCWAESVPFKNKTMYLSFVHFLNRLDKLHWECSNCCTYIYIPSKQREWAVPYVWFSDGVCWSVYLDSESDFLFFCATVSEQSTCRQSPWWAEVRSKRGWCKRWSRWSDSACATGTLHVMFRRSIAAKLLGKQFLFGLSSKAEIYYIKFLSRNILN